MNNHNLKILLIIFLSFAVTANDLNIPHEFSANTPASAAEVNANFNAIENSVDDNNSRLNYIESVIAQLQNSINTANTTISQLENDLITANATISNLQNSLALIENNSVLELDGFLKLSEIDGYDTAEFTSVNIQLNNGTNTTNGTVNGLGNFVIGYNEVKSFAPEFCSDPQYTDSVNCIGNLHEWGNNVHTGSHNIILGVGNSYTQYSSIVSGYLNAANNEYASSLGGTRNIASGSYSTITGGSDNFTSGYSSSISGGNNNTASGGRSSISGGNHNITTGDSASISGGSTGQANGSGSSISGGDNNTVNGSFSHVSGGRNNETPTGTHWSTVSGGNTRSTSGFDDWVGGSLFENN